MHCITKFNINEQCTEEVWSTTKHKLEEWINRYNNCNIKEKKEKLWREIVANVPCGFILGATMTTNYRQLKTIYKQRRFHKLKEWHQFCDWIERLPNHEWITGSKETQNEETRL